MYKLRPIISFLYIIIIFSSCSQGSLCNCKKKYFEDLSKKSNEKSVKLQEKNTDSKEIEDCINVWRNATIEEQKEMLDETKKCR